jgi:hypothetical protein
MPVSSKLALPAIVALAALTSAAPGASAQSLEITKEAAGEHCPRVSASGNEIDGGCAMHAASEGGVTILGNAFGVEMTIATCRSEAHLRVDEDGEGYVVEPRLTGPGCTRKPCPERGRLEPWPISAEKGRPTGDREGRGTDNDAYLRITICLSPIGQVSREERCAVDLGFDFTEEGHSYEFGHSSSSFRIPGLAGFRCELQGHWSTEIGGTHDGDGERAVTIAPSSH